MGLTVQLLIALGAAVFLALKSSRTFGIIAALGAGLALLMVQGFVSIHASGFPLMLIVYGAITVGGAGAWMETSRKIPITVATMVTTVGAVQMLGLL